MVDKIFYKGIEISKSDITVEWTNHWGKTKNGDIDDFAADYAEDRVSEAEAGEGW
ncbi:MAG: hypothetical protein [Wendovervirus sonii]|uniref:Uncharacterized protein n=1 Tax=phage Lak_Megaphage_Sonny TaxID=3109229 RepID=A0ABZ0Z2H1_9CAUD|nr:MAG: hypothetical protein [phage Lak_Megaphage_Sonny]